ncbi:techylectin-5B-like isoform X1 [Macrobrachium nipponense]|uniref:techylectin-5B-like isoform X1 n=1 Tax=Macrobrachium nipponense TaxID=159736 RepID=UPI0030C89556
MTKMEWSSVLLVFLSTIMCTTAFDSDCPIGDAEICSTVMSNQLNITEVRGEMDQVLADIKDELRKNREDMKELMVHLQRDTAQAALKFEELAKCQTQTSENVEVRSKLETKKKELMKETQKKLDARNQLQEEVESLKQRKAASLEKIQCLKGQIKSREELIANLSILAHAPLDCADLQLKGLKKSGVYTIHPMQNETKLQVVCDFETDGGGWTVFFNRAIQVNPVNFNLSWSDYKNGIGNASGEYWMGLDFLHLLTSYYPTSLRFEASDFKKVEKFAEYNTFRVDNEENNYKLTLNGYQNDSTMFDNLATNNNCYFTTSDRDNDNFISRNCATYTNVGHGGWWYSNCGYSRLTAPLSNSASWSSASVYNWDKPRKTVSLKTISLKFRRHNYKDFANVRGSGI